MDNRHFGTPEEKADDKEVCEELVANLSEGKRNQVLNLLSKFDGRTLYELSLASPAILRCCAEPAFNKLLVQSKQYPKELPRESIRSLDGALVLTPFKQLMGHFLVTESNKLLKTNAVDSWEILDTACVSGSYHALNERMTRNLGKLQEMKTVEAEPAEVKQIRKDAERMGELYRNLGYFQAASYLIRAAAALIKTPKVEEERKQFLTDVTKVSRAEGLSLDVERTDMVKLIDDLITQGWEYFCLSFFSHSSPMSLKLNNAILCGNSLLADFKEYFNDWDAAKQFFVSRLPAFFDKRTPPLLSSAENAAEKKASKLSEEFPDCPKKDL